MREGIGIGYSRLWRAGTSPAVKTATTSMRSSQSASVNFYHQGCSIPARWLGNGKWLVATTAPPSR
jgi:hypothetical protein